MKKIVFAVVLICSANAFATEFCTVSPQDTYVSVACSDIESGAAKAVNKFLPVVLKEKLDDGYKIENTVTTLTGSNNVNRPLIIYNLIKH